MPAMYEKESVEKQTVKLASGMEVLGVPRIVTTQYSKGLGQTIESVSNALDEYKLFDKFTFSA